MREVGQLAHLIEHRVGDGGLPVTRVDGCVSTVRVNPDIALAIGYAHAVALNHDRRPAFLCHRYPVGVVHPEVV